ncbi:hypothetical protein FJZ53_01395 [Candidatus Woesearchaeota archaeon]|nr:hypothetical protein [Candidatus Woesearchaeota archaeon]
MNNKAEQLNKDPGYSLIEKAYATALQKFPNIKKEEISLNVVFDSLGKDFILGIVVNSPSESIKYGVKARILAGLQFFLFKDREMEAGIAHELGHYEHAMKSYNDNRILRMKRFFEQTAKYAMPNLSTSIKLLFNKKHKHRWKRLQKWYIMKEMYADNKAFEAGYGAYVLADLKVLMPFLYSQKGTSELTFKETEARIKNLEEKLGI